MFVNKNERLFPDILLEQLQNSQHYGIYSLPMLMSRAIATVVCATESHARSTACTLRKESQREIATKLQF